MIIIFNGVCNYGLVIAELLSRFQIPCKLYTINEVPRDFLNLFLFFDKKNIITGDKNLLYKSLKDSSLCINVSMGIIDSMGIKHLLYKVFLKKIPIINIPTGSDISEIKIESRLRRIIFLIILKYGATLIPHYMHSINVLFQSRLKRIFFSRHPYILQNKKKSPDNKNIIFLHPSNLDWGIVDKKLGRNSMKNNVIFINGFIKAAREYYQHNGTNLKCFILERGPDKNVAKELIEKKKGSDLFEWLPPTSSTDLVKYISKSDIVVDQFELGIFGMISMEAMAQAKPVMIHIDKNYWPLVYSDEPPVINCHTEDEIYNAILEWTDKKKLKDLGEKAEKWVRKHHDVHTADFSEFILRVCLAAGLEWPRKDLAKIEK